MGGKTTKPASGNLLEGSTWLRTVVQHYQKRRHGVSGFDRSEILKITISYFVFIAMHAQIMLKEVFLP